VETILGELQGNGTADAAAGAGDESDFLDWERGHARTPGENKTIV